MSVLSVYYAPEHARQSDRDYIAALQPPVVRILDPDVQQLADVHGLAPNAILAPRTWVIDDNDGAAVRNLMADPTGTGRDHAQQYRSQLDGWRREASSRGITLPADNRFIFNAANEPNQGGTPDKICAYNIAFLDRCTELGIRAAALCLGVGWPANTGEGTPVDWTPYAGLDHAILRGDHWMELHEYYYKSGPQDGWGWWAGRHLQCPFAVPIFLGEVGIDNYVDNGRWQVEGGNRGWQGNVSPDVYADMTLRHIQGSDGRVLAAMPFITDYRDNGWQSFDTNPAHNAFVSRAAHMIPQGGSGPEPQPPEPPEPTPTPPDSQLVHPLPGAVITQHWGQNGDAYAAYGMWGHNGCDLGGVPAGTPIHCIAAGVVVWSDFDDGYGYYCRVMHDQLDKYSFYAHMEAAGAPVGKVLNAGATVGAVGSTGNSTGPHLHLEIRDMNADGSYSEFTPMPKGRLDPETFCAMYGLKL